jgi:hypothetical protein
MSTQLQHSLTFKEIDSIRHQVLSVMNNIESVKYRIMTQDHRQLTNHLQYVLGTLTNMSNILAVEKADPYSSQQADYTKVTGISGKKVIYNQDGSTRIIDSASVHTTGEDWERQFDEGLLMKPPCFQMPPQNLTSIPRIRQASTQNLTHNL